MKYAEFRATCPFEIGDKIKIPVANQIKSLAWDGDITVIKGVKEHVITDIACIHYLKTRKVTFKYELDNSGHYVEIRQIAGNGVCLNHEL